LILAVFQRFDELIGRLELLQAVQSKIKNFLGVWLVIWLRPGWHPANRFYDRPRWTMRIPPREGRGRGDTNVHIFIAKRLSQKPLARFVVHAPGC
jgi:hypothetical protein